MTEPGTTALTLTHAVVFDGVSEELVEGSVRVVDGRIEAVGEVDAQPGDVVLDARGRTVVPGLIDAHFHAYGISLDGMSTDRTRLSYVSLAGARRLRAALGRGFTTVRDVAGGDPGLARAIEEGLVPAPRYLYSGPALSQTGGHGDSRPAGLDHCAEPGHGGEVVDGVDAIRRAVRERFRTGAHCIKIMSSGGVMSPTDPIRLVQYSGEEVTAATEEAARRESYVAAHAYPPAAILHAVRHGVRTIEHGNLMDAEAAAVMAEHGAYLVPTLAAYDAMDRRGDEIALDAAGKAKNQEVLGAGKHAIELARAAGVTIGFGTDLMGHLEEDQLVGLRLQAEVEGVLELLRSATSVNAEILQRPDLGRIAPGAVGDLLLLDGDPFTDGSVLWDPTRPRTVIRGGVVQS